MPKSSRLTVLDPDSRQQLLIARRNARMARSTHIYVRGNTSKFYDWLQEADVRRLPQGPAIWICGDCHTGNLGPVADKDKHIEVQIRDLDQTVIGNPVHDLIRLGLSLATAARSSALPGVTTIQMIEALFEGYALALAQEGTAGDECRKPKLVRVVMNKALRRSWKQLARERLDGAQPAIPFGSHFWRISEDERAEIDALFQLQSVTQLATRLRGRPDTGKVTVLDAAYWVKGCSSLGRLRYAVLLSVEGGAHGHDFCLIDIKEGTKAAAPRYPGQKMPRDNARRVMEGARHLAPSLGERMRCATLRERPVVLRELLPQDLKLKIERIGRAEAKEIARYLAFVIGQAHARQMDEPIRHSWLAELKRTNTKSIGAPPWLWKSIVELVGSHEAGYLEHCRAFALTTA